MPPPKPPFPVPRRLPFHPATGIQSSILMSESGLGINAARTRQKDGKSPNRDAVPHSADPGPPRPRPWPAPPAPRPAPSPTPAPAPRAGGGGGAATPPLAGGNWTNVPASTTLASMIVVCGSGSVARLSHDAAAAGRAVTNSAASMMPGMRRLRMALLVHYGFLHTKFTASSVL